MLKLNLDNKGIINDVDFFSQLESSLNLDRIFDSEEDDSDDQSLKYKRTKQPHSQIASNITSMQAQSWKTELALVATAYKMGAPMGKVGAALLRNADNNFRIVIYKTKSSILSSLTLKKEDLINHTYIYIQDRYIQFYDENMIFWSLMFDKAEDRQAFIDKLNFFNIKIKKETETKTPNKKTETVKEVLTIDTDEPVNEPDEPKSNTSTLLISRISKIGQQLPVVPAPGKKIYDWTAATTEYSDSSDGEVVAPPVMASNKPTIASKYNAMTKIKTNQLVPASNSTNSYGSTTQFNAIESQVLQMMVTENSIQNTEMRMVINKLESKIEKVLDKVDVMSKGANQKTNNDDEIIALEEKLLELKKENRKLRQTMANNAQRINEESFHNLCIMHSDDLESLGIKSMTDPEKVFSDLIEKSKQIQQNNIRNESNLEEQLKKNQLLEQELNTAKENDIALKEIIRKSQNEVENTKQSYQIKENEVEALNQKLRELLQEQEKTEQNPILQEKSQNGIILRIMNNLYASLAAKIETLNVLDKTQVAAIIGQTIREESLKVIRK